MRSATKTKDEASRLESLTEHAILDTLPEEEYEDIVAMASYICKAPIALISLVDAERQWFKAKIGLEAQETPREIAFCAHAILQPHGGVFEVGDALADPRFSDNPLVISAPNIRFYAGATIFGGDGAAFGTVCVIDTVPRQLTPEQTAMLERLARQTSALLKLRHTEARDKEHLAQIRVLRDAAERDKGYSQDLLNLALRSGNFGLWDLDTHTGAWTINDREREILGLSIDEATPDRFAWHTLVHRDDLGLLDRALKAHLAGKTPFYECEHRMRHAKGHWVWVHTRGTVVERNGDEPHRIVGTHQDVTQARSDRFALEHVNEVLHRTNALAKVGWWEFDLTTKELTWSEEVYRIHEVPISRKTDLTTAINYYTAASRTLIEEALETCTASGHPYDLELELVTAKGRPIWVRAQGAAALQNGRVTRLVGALQDITEHKLSALALLDLNEKLAKLSMTDGLTGIGNRRLFDDMLVSEWQRAARQRLTVGLLMIDVDHFKAFNDRYGHLAGDLCLKRIATALAFSIKRPADLVARFGGEEFVVLLPDTSEEGTLAVARACMAAIAAEKIRIEGAGGVTSHVTVSIGMAALSPQPNSDASALVDRADAALYRAKGAGRAQIAR